MAYTEQKEKKKSKKGAIIAAAVLVLFGFLDEISEEFLAAVIILAVAAVFIWVIVAVAKAGKAAKRPNVHTHDRIDHRTDVKIDSRTGRAVSTPVRQAVPHSAKEHWKQQMDALYANGTIDRAEYRAMMKRKF